MVYETRIFTYYVYEYIPSTHALQIDIFSKLYASLYVHTISINVGRINQAFFKQRPALILWSATQPSDLGGWFAPVIQHSMEIYPVDAQYVLWERRQFHCYVQSTDISGFSSQVSVSRHLWLCVIDPRYHPWVWHNSLDSGQGSFNHPTWLIHLAVISVMSSTLHAFHQFYLVVSGNIHRNSSVPFLYRYVLHLIIPSLLIQYQEYAGMIAYCINQFKSSHS